MGLWEHDTWLEEKTTLTKEQQADVLQLINDCITAGLRLGQSLDFKAVKDDYAKSWDLIDQKKLPYVKRLAHMLEDVTEGTDLASYDSADSENVTNPQGGGEGKQTDE